MPKVLVFLPEGFEEIETITPVDLLRRAGAEVILATLDETREATGRCNLTLRADASLASVAKDTFDLLLIPGGPGVKRLRGDPRVIALVKAQAAAQRWIAAICAAPTVLLDAEVLGSHRHTAHTSVADELPGRLADERVVVDGKIITSRGAGTALDFGFAVVTALWGEAKRDEIFKAICA